MFKNTQAFSSFSVDDLEKAREFYGETLGIELEELTGMGLRVGLSGGGSFFIYPRENHQPASFTILNFVVDDIDATMNALAKKGVEFLHYNRDDLPQDEGGVVRGGVSGMGPDIAWFEDPAGNVLSILQEK